MSFFRRLFSTKTSTSPIAVAQLDSLSKLMHEVNSIASIAGKRSVLKRYPDCHSTLMRIYDPHYRLFLTSESAKNFIKTEEIAKLPSTPYTNLNELLDDLASRRITGRAAKEAIVTFYFTHCKIKAHQDVFWKVVDRNMKMGVSFRILRQMISSPTQSGSERTNMNDNDSVKKANTSFAVALAHSVTSKKKPLDMVEDTWYASQKLDGIRCITMITYDEQLQKYNINFYSRTGRPFSSLRKVKENIEQRLTEFGKEFPSKEFVLDGEICAYHGADVVKEDFLKALSELRKLNTDMQNPVYQIFDLIQLSHFLQAESDVVFHSRQTELQKFIGKQQLPHIKLVEQIQVKNMDQLNDLKAKAAKLGWEGLILRKDIAYEGKRTRNMLKLKEWEDAEYIVQSVEMGFMRMPDTGEDRNVLTNVNVLHKGNAVSVGSGFTLSERIKYAEHPEMIIGKPITVRYFAETKRDDGTVSLRFPSVKAVYEEGNRSM